MKKGVARLLFLLSARLPDGELTPLHPIVWNVRDEPYPDFLLLSGVRVGAETERLEITWNTVLFAFVFYVDVVVDFQLLRCRIGGDLYGESFDLVFSESGHRVSSDTELLNTFRNDP